MNVYKGEVVIRVAVEAFNLEDAVDEIYNEFGQGTYGAVEVIDTNIDNLE